MQEKQSEMNKVAWSTKAYEAWNRLYGTPAEAAALMKRDPESYLKRQLAHMGDVRGKRVINLCGSHGRRAVPLALLGAEVTVADISVENRRYALEVAEEAGVMLPYFLTDVMKLPEMKLDQSFDFVLMEFGVLHYFADLHSLFAVVAGLLRDGGRYVLTDFHPYRKTLDGGSYFELDFIEGQVAYYPYMTEAEQQELKPVLVRRWTMGEIVTALAASGMIIRKLIEEPDKGNPRIPGNYTLVADKKD